MFILAHMVQCFGERYFNFFNCSYNIQICVINVNIFMYGTSMLDKYLVKWKGYSKSCNSCVPKKTLENL